MTLQDWLIGKDLSNNEHKKLDKHMNVKVKHEFIRHNEDTWVSWSEVGSHKNVHNWVLLSNGLAVGWNENPARGWSFPSKKISTEIEEHINKKV